MSGRKFHVDRSTGEISALWEQRVLVERFALISGDLSFLFQNLHELSMRYPVEYRGVFLKGAEETIEGIKDVFEQRFPELSRVPTGHLRDNNKNSDDDKIDLGEL